MKFKESVFTPKYKTIYESQAKEIEGLQYGGLIVHKLHKSYAISHYKSGDLLISGYGTQSQAKMDTLLLEQIHPTDAIESLDHEWLHNPEFQEFIDTAKRLKRNIRY